MPEREKKQQGPPMLADIVDALEGYASGDGYLLCCPAHDDHNPSLSVRGAGDGRVLVHCHAGCSQEAVVSALKAMGLWGSGASKPSPSKAPRPTPKGSDNRAVALAIWKECEAPQGTPVETYLHSRGLRIPDIGSDSLRFHPNLKHPTGGYHPAMVALVTNGKDGTPCGIHRTYLLRDGSGKAELNPNKMMLGPCSGGSVRLTTGTNPLMLGEGIETCLTVVQERNANVWSALSTSGLRALELPLSVSTVTLLADGDDAGESAAVAVARRLVREHLSVSIARAPRGMDFNDLLLQGASK